MQYVVEEEHLRYHPRSQCVANLLLASRGVGLQSAAISHFLGAILHDRMPVRSATVLTGLPWRDAGAEQRQTAHSALERLAVGVGAGALLRPDLAELGTAHRATRPVAWDPRQRRLAGV